MLEGRHGLWVGPWKSWTGQNVSEGHPDGTTVNQSTK